MELTTQVQILDEIIRISIYANALVKGCIPLKKLTLCHILLMTEGLGDCTDNKNL